MDTTKQYYQHYYQHLRGDIQDIEYAKLFRLADTYARSLIDNYFPSGTTQSILEIACGFGGLIQSLRNQGYTNVLGIDISKEQKEIAEKFGIRDVLQAEAIHFLETDKRQWDIIISLEFIEHLSKEEVIEFLCLCRRRLHPGGRLILRTLNCTSPFFGMYAFGDFTHRTFFTETSLRQVLHQAGFSRVEIFPFRHNRRNIKGYIHGMFSQGVISIFQIILSCYTGKYRPSTILTPTIEAMATA
jgi:2-polyprenyl-3-methyl-5-hydroxy-6-metoxy-1,4-benzoquinol methylase